MFGAEWGEQGGEGFAERSACEIVGRRLGRRDKCVGKTAVKLEGKPEGVLAEKSCQMIEVRLDEDF